MKIFLDFMLSGGKIKCFSFEVMKISLIFSFGIILYWVDLGEKAGRWGRIIPCGENGCSVPSWNFVTPSMSLFLLDFSLL